MVRRSPTELVALALAVSVAEELTRVAVICAPSKLSR